jgi:DNA repair exonuclease SbcCD ATPase subunit
MADALRYHIQEREDLTKQNDALLEHHKGMVEEKKLHDEIVRQKIVNSRTQSIQIKELEKKIHQLEHSLSFVIREFEHERALIQDLTRKELDDVRSVTDYLQERLKEKTQEIQNLRALGKYIYNSRSDIERFFLESLEYVRQQKVLEKQRHREEMQKKYREHIRQVRKARSDSFRDC